MPPYLRQENIREILAVLGAPGHTRRWKTAQSALHAAAALRAKAFRAFGAAAEVAHTASPAAAHPCVAEREFVARAGALPAAARV